MHGENQMEKGAGELLRVEPLRQCLRLLQAQEILHTWCLVFFSAELLFSVFFYNKYLFAAERNENPFSRYLRKSFCYVLN